jgi:integrin alpha FG-GAP repeat containing protein 1
MLFTTCDSVSSYSGIGQGCSINIAYNKQLPLCASATTPSVKNGQMVCRTPQALCTADQDFKFDLNEGDDNPVSCCNLCALQRKTNASTQDFVRTPISALFPGQQSPSLLVLDTSVSPPVPLPIKLGDANHDGFPDLLAIVTSGTSSNSDRTPTVAFSEPCAKGVPGCSANGTGRRGWSVLKKGAEVLSGIKDARSVAFLDMDEDVSLSHRYNGGSNLTICIGHFRYHGPAVRPSGRRKYYLRAK